jgi:hypothetical protein
MAASAYPLYKASRIVVRSLERKWRMPKPKGRELFVPLPYRAEEVEVLGIMGFLEEYFKTFTIQQRASLAIEEISREEREVDGGHVQALHMLLLLAPFEYGVRMKADLEASRGGSMG